MIKLTDIVSKAHKDKEEEMKCPMCSRYLCKSCFEDSKGTKICHDCSLNIKKSNTLKIMITFIVALVLGLTSVLLLI